MHVNLLPPEFLAEQAVERKSRRWGLVLFTVIMCGAFALVRQYQANQQLQIALEGIREQTNELRQVITDTTRADKELTHLRKDISAAELARSNRHTLTLMEIVAQCARDSGKHIQVRRIQIQPAAIAPGALAVRPVASNEATAQAASAAAGEMTIDGVAEDGPAIANFIEAARATGVFAGVVLRSSSSSPGAGFGARQFQVVAQY